MIAFTADPVTGDWSGSGCVDPVAGDELAAAQGTNDPSLWRKSATPERIVFQAPVVIPITMRWTNRPTFQQVLEFGP